MLSTFRACTTMLVLRPIFGHFNQHVKKQKQNRGYTEPNRENCLGTSSSFCMATDNQLINHVLKFNVLHPKESDTLLIPLKSMGPEQCSRLHYFSVLRLPLWNGKISKELIGFLTGQNYLFEFREICTFQICNGR